MPAHASDDTLAAIEYAFAQGWSDGLPVVPPTAGRVESMLGMWNCEAGEEIGRIPARHRVITMQQAAANAIMAGCIDEMFPVVLAAIEAVLDERFNVIGPTASTGGAAPLVIVHGPIVEELEFNTGAAILGAGNRANLTLGRALNLVIRNAVGSVPGDLDQATTGHPGRIAYCLPEGPAGDWPPLAAELSVPAGVSAVTVYAAEAPHSVAEHATEDAHQLLEAFARVARATNYAGGVIVAVVCPEHRAVFQAAGWSKADIRETLFAATTVPARDLHHTGRHGSTGAEIDLVPSVDDIWIVAGGGPAGGHSAIIPPWLGSARGTGSRPVTAGGGVCIDC